MAECPRLFDMSRLSIDSNQMHAILKWTSLAPVNEGNETHKHYVIIAGCQVAWVPGANYHQNRQMKSPRQLRDEAKRI